MSADDAAAVSLQRKESVKNRYSNGGKGSAVSEATFVWYMQQNECCGTFMLWHGAATTINASVQCSRINGDNGD